MNLSSSFERKQSFLPLCSHRIIRYMMLIPLKFLSHLKVFQCLCHGTRLSSNQAHSGGWFSRLLLAYLRNMNCVISESSERFHSERPDEKDCTWIHAYPSKVSWREALLPSSSSLVCSFELLEAGLLVAGCFWEYLHYSPSTHQFRGKCLRNRAVWESVTQPPRSLLNWFNPILVLMRETPVSALSKM